MLFKWGSGAGSNLSAIRGSMETLERRRHRRRAALLHARLRRLRRRHQVRRQDPSRRQDGHPQRRPPRHHGLHQLQGHRREEGMDPRSRPATTAPRPRLRSLQQYLLPERQQLRPRHRRVHGRGRLPTRLLHPHRKRPSPRSRRYKARDIMHAIAEATWQCGDPGMQYDTTINPLAHQCKNTARINASNPCSEYMFLDDSACNLASFNLLKFLTPGGPVRRPRLPPRHQHRRHRHGDHRRRRRLPHRD